LILRTTSRRAHASCSSASGDVERPADGPGLRARSSSASAALARSANDRDRRTTAGRRPQCRSGTTLLRPVRRGSILLFAGVLFGCGTPSPSVVARGSHCYVLTVGPWSAVPDHGLSVPRVIQLAPSRDHPWRKWLRNDTGYHVARAWQADGSPSMAFDLWRHTRGDSVRVGPFLRPAGYTLTLAEGDPPLSGTMTFFTDGVPPAPPPPPQAAVVARPTPCPSSSERDQNP
jgi:hypothetical protein